MALLSQIEDRYSARSYHSHPVEEEKLQNILEAARLAPTARNVQGWRLVVVQDAQLRSKLVPAANNQVSVKEAPVLLVCCATNTDHVMRCGQPAYPIDAAIVIDHMTLQAVEEGLGTCWIGSFYEDQVKSVLGIPDGVRVVGLLTLGYPADKPKPKSRLPLTDLVSYDGWSFEG